MFVRFLRFGGRIRRPRAGWHPLSVIESTPAGVIPIRICHVLAPAVHS
jgi:hypothetical protein